MKRNRTGTRPDRRSQTFCPRIKYPRERPTFLRRQKWSAIRRRKAVLDGSVRLSSKSTSQGQIFRLRCGSSIAGGRESPTALKVRRDRLSHGVVMPMESTHVKHFNSAVKIFCHRPKKKSYFGSSVDSSRLVLAVPGVFASKSVRLFSHFFSSATNFQRVPPFRASAVLNCR